MGKAAKTVIVIGSGIASLFIGSVLIFALTVWSKFAIYDFTIWFVPIGAVGCGWLVGSGYYFALKAFGQRPSRPLMAMAAITSAAALPLLYLFEYLFSRTGGRAFRTLMSYGSYVEQRVSHLAVQLSFNLQSVGSPIEADPLGPILFLVKIVCFALGAVGILSILNSKAYCEDCKRFLKSDGRQRRYFEQPAEIGAFMTTLQKAALEGQLQRSIATHAVSGFYKDANPSNFQSDIDVYQCGGCRKYKVRHQLRSWAGKEFRDVPGGLFSAVTSEKITLRGLGRPSS